MCGHATLALGKWLVESGQVPAIEPETRFFLELPCGLIEVMCRVEKGAVTTAAFDSVPAFLSRADVSLDVPGLGRVTFDLAYGGAFYALRSEEHTSELQSLMRLSYAVFCLKNKKTTYST